MNSDARNTRIRFTLIIAVLSAILASNTLYAQEEVHEVVVPEEGVAYTAFPEIRVRAIVSDETRGRVTGLTETDFVLREDGEEMSFTLDEVPVGLQAVFILDASLDTKRAGSTGYSRLEEGKQIIYDFARDHMAEGMDQIAVLAPESSTTVQKVAPLADDPADFTTFKNTVHDGTYLYELPEDIGATPLNDMVSTALNMLARAQNGLHKAVVVISDGIDVISDREVTDIVNKANQNGVPIYTVIFGPPSNWGGQPESNMKRLSLDTFGEHFQLSAEASKPAPIEDLINQVIAPLFETLISQRHQYLLTYHSEVTSPGVHQVAVAVGTRSDEIGVSLSIKPPQVTIIRPVAGENITRETDDPDMPQADIEPRTKTVDFETSWPDGFERKITKVELLVDGAVRDTCDPPCDQIAWDIASERAGSHSIRVRVRDQQGMEAYSDEVPLTISILVPTPASTATSSAPQAATEARGAAEAPSVSIPAMLTCEETYSGLNRVVKCNPEILVLGALGVSLAALLLAIIVARRPPTVVTEAARRVKDVTEPFFPVRGQRQKPSGVIATLDVLEGDDSYIQPIEIISDNTRLGRNEELVQVVFRNPSVSRLHARITVQLDEKGGRRFLLYDEGSTSGTYVNYEPVGIHGQILLDNDTIHLGQVRLKFNVKPGFAFDDTIAMKPVLPKQDESEDDFITKPHEPAYPEPDLDDTYSLEGESSDEEPGPQQTYENDKEDRIETEGYAPMDFNDE